MYANDGFTCDNNRWTENAKGMGMAALSNIMAHLSIQHGSWKAAIPPDFSTAKDMGPIEMFGVASHRTGVPLQWEEGFSLMVVARWDAVVAREIILNWLNNMQVPCRPSQHTHSQISVVYIPPALQSSSSRYTLHIAHCIRSAALQPPSTADTCLKRPLLLLCTFRREDGFLELSFRQAGGSAMISSSKTHSTRIRPPSCLHSRRCSTKVRRRVTS